jgi:hypothetical protein
MSVPLKDNMCTAELQLIASKESIDMLVTMSRTNIYITIGIIMYVPNTQLWLSGFQIICDFLINSRLPSYNAHPMSDILTIFAFSQIGNHP